MPCRVGRTERIYTRNTDRADYYLTIRLLDIDGKLNEQVLVKRLWVVRVDCNRRVGKRKKLDLICLRY